MRKLIYALVLPLTVVLSTACSDDDEKTFGDLTVDNKKELTQSLSADENSATVTFTARDSWAASVTDATATRAGLSWLSLDRYEGGAGSYTLKITLTDNTSGADRKAVITITTAGGDTFDVQITQVKTNKDGTTPPTVGTPDEGAALVDKVIREHWDGGYQEETVTIDFVYDTSDRITEITYTEGDYTVKRYLLSYGTDKITVVEHYDFDATESYRSRSVSAKPGSDGVGNRRNSRGAAATRAEDYYQKDYTFNLNSNGYITSASSIDYDEWRYDWKVTYDSQNYIEKVEFTETDNYDNYIVDCRWTDGNLTRVDIDYLEFDSYFSTAVYDDSSDNEKANIDLNFLAVQADEYLRIDRSGIMVMLGYYGQRSRGLMTGSQATEESGYVYGTQTYTYTRNSDGLIDGIRVVNRFDEDYFDLDEYTIVYK
ncbi:MAG: hypothetical protein LIO85_07320 [Rikenellaceae bacterium]|nr:hypothetical protein [Rikenellaceae bacterium]